MKPIRILVVDDEASIREMLAMALEEQGYEVIQAVDGQDAYSKIIDLNPDLMLLDWMMPKMSGIELARRLSRESKIQDIPVIMLTAKAEEEARIQGLESGVDDYIAKPFSVRELLARVKAVLRRTNPAVLEKAIAVEGLSLDPASQRVLVNDQPLNLGPTEYRLLEFFMTHPERAYTRVNLLDQVWGANVYIEDRTVDVHIRRLRRALEPSGYARFIQTVRGTGYRFSTQVDASSSSTGAEE